MPNVTNVVLNLQHGGGGNLPTSSRNATVTFTTRFTSTEILAGVFYNARVVIRPDDSNTEIFIRNVVIRAASGNVVSNASRILERQQLDEDFDLRPNPTPPPPFLPFENADEWLAKVTLTPFQFGTAVGESVSPVTGSWGRAGSD